MATRSVVAFFSELLMYPSEASLAKAIEVNTGPVVSKMIAADAE